MINAFIMREVESKIPASDLQPAAQRPNKKSRARPSAGGDNSPRMIAFQGRIEF
jgi:hypothetical protein